MPASKPINIDSDTVEKTVRKCKKCDTLLGKKDKHQHPSEIKAKRERAIKSHEREKEKQKRVRLKQEETRRLHAAHKEKMDIAAGVGTAKLKDARFNSICNLSIIGFVIWLLIPLLLGTSYFSTLIMTGVFFWPIWGLLSYFLPYIYYKRRYGRRLEPDPLPPVINTKNPSQADFKPKNLCESGGATAQLIDDNLVQIVGGTEEEQATCVNWVKENHPEYEIT